MDAADIYYSADDVDQWRREQHMALVKREVQKGAKKKTGVAKKTDAPVEEFKLPTELSVPSDNLQDYSILLYGEKKIGKTTLATMFPDALALMTEPGGRALRIYQMPINDFPTARKALRALKKDTSFRTVIVDTVDMLYRRCFEYTMKDLDIDHPSEEKWGKGWDAIRTNFTGFMADLLALDKGVVLISHDTEKEITRRDGTKYDRIQPTMPNMARESVEALVDIWMYYHYQRSDRYIQLRGDDHVACGHRLQEHFRTPDGEGYVDYIAMGTSPQEGFANLLAAFNNEYEPPFPAKTADTDDTPVPVKKKIKKKA